MLVRVRGRSMLPTLREGDYILLRRCGRWFSPGEGDIVCVHRCGEPMLVKRLGRRAGDGTYALSGDGAASRPSVDLGRVSPEEVVGRAVACLSGGSIRLLRRRPRRASRCRFTR
ncbi:S24/S26 family peptidase [Novosphingobium sp.]|uniref:S24/S26 family peptidase n=1 Tax=Novosphingobium sp. TaxID=1874826 RepID=UPI0025CC43BF|nr:S24/S26 family peptidase [Novosphingobium sp.]